MELSTLKNKLINSLPLWIDERINGLVANNPKLKIASVYIKRGAKNYIAREQKAINDMIDTAALFICDENGNLNADLIFSDMMQMFRDMDEIPFNSGFLKGTIGKGVIRINLPDNPITNMLLGNTSSLKITDSDINELKNILTAP